MKNLNINGKFLDDNQMKVVLCNNPYILVVAGAGSGKSFTIVGKVKYLTENNISQDKILCISFTNDAVNSLKEKLSFCDVDVLTFHKLGLNIIKEYDSNFSICEPFYLEFIVDEFFYYVMYNDELLLKKILKYFGKSTLFNIYKKYRLLLKLDKFKSFKMLICKFIRLFKSNNYNISSFLLLYEKALNKKEKLFLQIVLNIYLIYEQELDSSGKIDFDDMLIKASRLIDEEKVLLNYKYIIVDEYQDVSFNRYNLIKSIIDKNNSKFMAVGDDFQSIYRFSGCSLNMFIDFLKYFPTGEILKLERTYRNSKSLIEVAGKFIMKNNNQIKKDLISDKDLYKPIKICYGYNVYELIKMINSDIMILGRNNRDISNIKLGDFDKKIYCLTVHCSKGLECDNVILLNCIDDRLGFPNKIEDNKILRFFSNGHKYLYDEERRLFYVALTRTKNNIYIITKYKKESIFLKELIRDYKDKIEIIKK